MAASDGPLGYSGAVRPFAERVDVVEPDPVWAQWFGLVREAVLGALGGAALAVDHVGSTSVPDLPAKPVVDALLQVVDSGDEEAYVPALEAVGFRVRVREPEWLEHRVLSRRVADGDRFDVNLHVLSPGTGDEEIRRMLGFRDWLRAHPDDRDRYAAVKRDLARREWRYVQDYADAKGDVVEDILRRALAR
jgi:GrpB-like predicted nucleotidyltransferase (UPF0157 family)